MKKAMDYLVRASFPQYTSECGKCARFLRTAVEEELGKPLERVTNAKDYGPSYEKVGFKKILCSTELGDYKPKHGDISIIQYEPHGHISMFCFGLDPVTGKPFEGWVSDFKQRDMYGGKIREKKPSFAIYRYDS